MGLFTNEYVLSASLQSSKLFDATANPDYLLDNVMKAVLGNTNPSISTRYQRPEISRSVLSAFINNYARNIDEYYDFGLNKHGGGYYITQNVIDSFDADPDLFARRQADAADIISRENGNTPVEVIDYFYQEMIPEMAVNEFVGRKKDFLVHGRISATYNDETKLAIPFTDIVRSPFVLNNIDGTPKLKNYMYQCAKYRWSIGGGAVDRAYQTFDPNPLLDNGIVFINKIYQNYDRTYSTDIGGFRLQTDWLNTSGKKYHQVLYRKLTDMEYRVWIYDEATNQHGNLHMPTFTARTDTHFPVAYIANTGVSRATSSAYYAFENDVKDGIGSYYTTTMLLKKLQINLEDIHNALVPNGKQDENYNKIEDAYISLSANLNSDEHHELLFVYEYFRRVYLELGTPVGGLFPTQFTDVTLKWAAVQMFLRNGNVDNANSTPGIENGHVVQDFDPNNDGLLKGKNTTNIGKITKQYIVGPQTGTINQNSRFKPNIPLFDDSIYVLRRQINATQYTELVIHGFRRTDVFKKLIGGKLGTYKVVNDISTLENDLCVVPLTRLALDQFNKMTQATIGYNCIRFTVRSQDVIVIKWWQDPNFWRLVQVAVFIVTFGWGEALNSVWAFLQNLAYNQILNMAIGAVLEMIVNLIGVEAALVLALIAVAYGGAKYGNELFGLIDAKELLSLAAQMATTVSKVVNDEFMELQKEQELYYDEREETLDILRELEEDLGGYGGYGKELYEITRAKHFININESPEDFFSRTIHNTNPGVLSLDMIDSYVERNLALPKIKEFI